MMFTPKVCYEGGGEGGGSATPSTSVDALKELYVALGGVANDVADLVTIPDMIHAIAQLDFSALA